MRLDKFLLAVGIFLLFITMGLGIMFGQGANKGIYQDYNITADDSSFANIPSDFNEAYNISGEINDDFLERKIEDNTGWENMIIGGYAALKTYTKSFGLVGRIIVGIGRVLPIPPEFISFAMIAIGISVIFTFIYLVFRFMPSE